MIDLAAGVRESSKERAVWIKVFVCAFLSLVVDGMDLMFLSLSLESLAREFSLTAVQQGALGSVSLAGMAIGGICGGIAADKYGRVRTLVWTVLVFSLGTGMLAFTHSYLQFAAVRFLSALGIGAVYVVANILVAEYTPTRHRTTALGTIQAGWSFGYVLASLLAWLIMPTLGWRYLFAIALVPVAMVFFMRKIPEPKSWLARKNNKPATGVKAKTVRQAREAIWKNKAVRHVFLAWCFTTAFLQFGYFGVNTWLPRYIEGEMGIPFRSMALFLVCTYTAMIGGKILAGIMADRFGRKAIFALGGIGTAIFMPIIIFWHSPDNILMLMTVFGFLYGIPYGVNATYMTESFDTQIRGVAMGTVYNLGRIGAAAAPLVIGWLAGQHSIGLGFLIVSASYFICGLVPLLFIRENIYNPEN